MINFGISKCCASKLNVNILFLGSDNVIVVVSSNIAVERWYSLLNLIRLPVTGGSVSIIVASESDKLWDACDVNRLSSVLSNK